MAYWAASQWMFARAFHAAPARVMLRHRHRIFHFGSSGTAWPERWAGDLIPNYLVAAPSLDLDPYPLAEVAEGQLSTAQQSVLLAVAKMAHNPKTVGTGIADGGIARDFRMDARAIEDFVAVVDHRPHKPNG